MAKDRLKSATGGRIGYKVGGFDKVRRKFLKMLGIGAGTTAAVKSGILRFSDTAAPKVIEKVAETTAKTTPPPYFFELADTIKKFGKVTDGPQERLKIHSLPSKDGKSELMLTEDIGTGEMQIKKISKENDQMTTEVQTMDYQPSSALSDEAGQVPGNYEEYTEFNSRIYKDNFNDPQIETGIDVKEIMSEIREAPPIKKAGGGIARMLGE